MLTVRSVLMELIEIVLIALVDLIFIKEGV